LTHSWRDARQVAVSDHVRAIDVLQRAIKWSLTLPLTESLIMHEAIAGKSLLNSWSDHLPLAVYLGMSPMLGRFSFIN
jgi:hypothetical protein